MAQVRTVTLKRRRTLLWDVVQRRQKSRLCAWACFGACPSFFSHGSWLPVSGARSLALISGLQARGPLLVLQRLLPDGCSVFATGFRFWLCVFDKTAECRALVLDFWYGFRVLAHTTQLLVQSAGCPFPALLFGVALVAGNISRGAGGWHVPSD